MTAPRDTDRCPQSDLPALSCAHCRGDDPTIQPGEPLRGVEPVGVAVWPVKDPKPVHAPRPAEEHSSDLRIRTARDLRAIRFMTGLLSERAEDLGGDSVMPGGDATAAAAPVALPSAWERRFELTEADWMRKQKNLAIAYGTHVTASDKGRPTIDDTDDWEPPLQTLLYWSEIWRHQLGMMHEQWTPTLDTEANFLASGDVLDWAWDHVTAFPVFATDVHDARTRLENVVRDGIRPTRSRILCDRPHPDKAHKRLNVLYSKTDDVDGYIAPCCKTRYTVDEATRALARQMRHAGAERFITTTEAMGALTVQGWQRRTILNWIEPLRELDVCQVCGRTWPAQEHAACPTPTRDGAGPVERCGGLLDRVIRGDSTQIPDSYCEITTHRTLVWWPDLWRRHIIAKAAKAERQRLRRMA